MSVINSVWKFYGDISPNNHFITVQYRFFKGHFLKISFHISGKISDDRKFRVICHHVGKLSSFHHFFLNVEGQKKKTPSVIFNSVENVSILLGGGVSGAER